jgi:DNA-binding NarL/FixJ family response regulator
VSRLLGDAVAELQVAVDELRELARGVHPAVLTEEGLAAAVESLAGRTPMAVSLDVLEERMPEQVEATAYFVVCEALTNVAKHAHASKAAVGAQRANGVVTVAIEDDGIGGAFAQGRIRTARARGPRRGNGGSSDDRESAERRHTHRCGDPVRVVIAEDSVLLREGLARVLTEQGFEVAAQVGDATELQRAVKRTKPDVAIVDVRMPPTQTDEGARAAEEIRAQHPDVGVLVLSQIVEARRALKLFSERPEGFGYLLKDRVLQIDEFVESVRRVGRGGTAIDPEVVAQLVGRRDAEGPLDELTPREREVLGLMAEGRSNKAICDKLFLSPKTVETHVNSIFGKLNLPQAPDDHRRVLAVLAFLRA